MADHGHGGGGGHAPATHSGSGSHSSGGGGGNFPLGTFGFILAILFMYLFYKQMHKSDYIIVANEKQYEWVVDYTLEVNFTSEYEAPINIGEGKDFAFKGATVPYCAKNESGFEVCGEKGESIAKNFQYTSANRMFYFKTKGDSISIGKIFVVFFKEVEKK
jgi:hypothetical protein